MFQRLLVDCGLPDDARLHLEWQVKPAKGKGKASHTDVMAKATGAALAIEAKWTEPRYKTVAVWLGKDGGSPNQRAVLEGWLDLLRPHATKDVRAEAFSGVVYQMIHRAASACENGIGIRPILAYLQFTPAPFALSNGKIHIQRDLANFHALLGHPSDFLFYFVEVEIEPTVSFEKMSSLRKGIPETGAAVREALQGAPLFEFGDIHVHNISVTP